jgi:hypothetical protein
MPGLENVAQMLYVHGDRCAYLGMDLRWHVVPRHVLAAYLTWHWLFAPKLVN